MERERFFATVLRATDDEISARDRAGALRTIRIITGRTRIYRVGDLLETAPTFTGGDEIGVLAEREGDSLVALVIELRVPDRGRVRARGTVVAWARARLTVRTERGEVWEVEIEPGTRVFAGGCEQREVPNLVAGSHVGVMARREPDGTLTALVLSVGGSRRR
jgi:hypothetical protein